MKKLWVKITVSSAIFLTLFFSSMMAFAQDVVAAPIDPTSEFVLDLVKAFATPEGVGTLAIAYIVVQLLIKFTNIPLFGEWFKEIDGETKLLVVSGLTIVATVLGLMQGPTGLSLGAALTSGGVLTSIAVYLNQIYQRFFVKKAVQDAVQNSAVV